MMFNDVESFHANIHQQFLLPHSSTPTHMLKSLLSQCTARSPCRFKSQIRHPFVADPTLHQAAKHLRTSPADVPNSSGFDRGSRSLESVVELLAKVRGVALACARSRVGFARISHSGTLGFAILARKTRNIGILRAESAHRSH